MGEGGWTRSGGGRVCVCACIHDYTFSRRRECDVCVCMYVYVTTMYGHTYLTNTCSVGFSHMYVQMEFGTWTHVVHGQKTYVRILSCEAFGL